MYTQWSIKFIFFCRLDNPDAVGIYFANFIAIPIIASIGWIISGTIKIYQANSFIQNTDNFLIRDNNWVICVGNT